MGFSEDPLPNPCSEIPETLLASRLAPENHPYATSTLRIEAKARTPANLVVEPLKPMGRRNPVALRRPPRGMPLRSSLPANPQAVPQLLVVPGPLQPLPALLGQLGQLAMVLLHHLAGRHKLSMRSPGKPPHTFRAPPTL